MSNPSPPPASGQLSHKRPAPIGYLLRQAHQRWRAALDDALRPLGLSLPQVAIMAALKQSPGLSNAELARTAFVTPQTMVQLLTSIEVAGLVVRRRHPAGG